MCTCAGWEVLCFHLAVQPTIANKNVLRARSSAGSSARGGKSVHEISRSNFSIAIVPLGSSDFPAITDARSLGQNTFACVRNRLRVDDAVLLNILFFFTATRGARRFFGRNGRRRLMRNCGWDFFFEEQKRRIDGWKSKGESWRGWNFTLLTNNFPVTQRSRFQKLISKFERLNEDGKGRTRRELFYCDGLLKFAEFHLYCGIKFWDLCSNDNSRRNPERIKYVWRGDSMTKISIKRWWRGKLIQRWFIKVVQSSSHRFWNKD